MPLMLLDDVGAGGVVGDLRARGFGIGIEAIAAPILDLGFFFALILPDLSRVSNLLARFKVAKWGGCRQATLQSRAPRFKQILFDRTPQSNSICKNGRELP